MRYAAWPVVPTPNWPRSVPVHLLRRNTTLVQLQNACRPNGVLVRPASRPEDDMAQIASAEPVASTSALIKALGPSSIRQYSCLLRAPVAHQTVSGDDCRETPNVDQPSILPSAQQANGLEMSPSVPIPGPSFFDRSEPPHFRPRPAPVCPPEADLDPPIGDSKHVSSLSHALQRHDFDGAVKSFDRLSALQKLHLSSHMYNSLFALAGAVHEEDKETISPREKSGAWSLSSDLPEADELRYRVDYRKVEGRLIVVDRLFQSIGRPLSSDQLHQLLHVTIHAAALRLWLSDHSAAPEATLPLNRPSEEQFLSTRDRVSAILRRLPALQDTPVPMTQQLAQAVPARILGLYSRFLAVFHQPNRGLKLLRKIYYAYLIGNRRLASTAKGPLKPCDLVPRGDRSGIETGSLIISILHHKTHHRFAALKLAVRMITIGGVYPDHYQVTSLLRRMYMSKQEWDSVIDFQTQLPDGLAAEWLKGQIAVVEAEDGQVQGVLRVARDALQASPGGHERPARLLALSLDVFSHTIQALLDCPQTDEGVVGANVRAAVGIRCWMIRAGVLPQAASDDSILRRLCHSACQIESPAVRREFLQEMIGMLFPCAKIVSMRSGFPKGYLFASHPGNSPEVFRLMRWLMRWDELELSLQVFQSMARYGYVTSLTAVPLSYLRRLLDKALYCHPELAMELYLHLHMAGCDSSGVLFEAVEAKAIHMGDYDLMGYLLRLSEETGKHPHAASITTIVRGFARRRATPGNVMKTLKLVELIWTRWASLVEMAVWQAVSEQVRRLGPLKLRKRPELVPRIEESIHKLRASGLVGAEVGRVAVELMEYLSVAKLVQEGSGGEADKRTSECLRLERADKEQTHDPASTGLDAVVEMGSEDGVGPPPKATRLISSQMDAGQVESAIETLRTAIRLDVLIPGPHVGRLLNMMVDQGWEEEEVKDLDAGWRGMSWRFRVDERGEDRSVVEAMDRISRSE